MTTFTAKSTASGALPRFWNLRDWRIGPRLVLALMLTTLLPLGVTAYFGTSLSRESLLAQGNNSLLSLSRETADQIDQYLAASREDIVMISQFPDIVAYASNPNDLSAKTDALKTLTAAAAKPDYDSVSIMDGAGVITLSSTAQDVGTKSPSSAYFQQALSGSAYISDPFIPAGVNQPILYFSAPIRDAAGNVAGVVRSRLRFDGIWSQVEGDKDKALRGAVGILLDENGIRLAHSLSLGNRDAIAQSLLFRAVGPLSDSRVRALLDENRFGAATAQGLRVLPLPDVAAAFLIPDIKIFETFADNSGVRHQGAMASLKSKPWRYVMMAPLPSFTGPADDLTRFSLIVGLGIAASVAILALLLGRAITRPLVQLTQVADRISLGELDAQINISRSDEIGDLAEAVSRMQSSLQAAIERLRARRSA